MILYKYTADCSKLNPEQEDATKEGHGSFYSRRSDITEWNSKFYTAYRTEKKFFIMIMTNVLTAFSCQRTFVIFYLLNSDITGGVVHNYAFSCIHRYIGCR